MALVSKKKKCKLIFIIHLIFSLFSSDPNGTWASAFRPHAPFLSGEFLASPGLSGSISDQVINNPTLSFNFYFFFMNMHAHFHLLSVYLYMYACDGMIEEGNVGIFFKFCVFRLFCSLVLMLCCLLLKWYNTLISGNA